MTKVGLRFSGKNDSFKAIFEGSADPFDLSLNKKKKQYESISRWVGFLLALKFMDIINSLHNTSVEE